MRAPDVSRSARREPGALAVAAALALGAAISLGLARFAYGLLLPAMRADLGWNYLTAGAMNTVNAAGYLIGALLMPATLRRIDARRLLLGGGVGTAALLAAHGLVLGDAALYALRFLTGIASAAIFVSGGLLAARLSSTAARAPARPGSSGHAPSAGLLLGIYYGGTGVGIVCAALLVPPLDALPVAHAWQWAWIALGATALLATAITAFVTRDLERTGGTAAARSPMPWSRLACGLTSYFLFGLGYIGYMTFVVTLLREQRLSNALISAFFGLLGVAVIGSSWWWAGLLQRHRSGGAMRLLNGLLALATVMPVLSTHPIAVFASGALFGGVFLSVVASTTALVRHNLPSAAWPAGITAFTIVFAAGQIVGPSLVGWVADGAGGLRGGLACAAAVLALAALIASGQKALDAQRS